MTLPRVPRLQPGEDPSQAKFNTLADVVEQRLRSVPAVGGVGGFGSAAQTPEPEYFWVRVTAAGSGTPKPYSFVEVIEDRDTGEWVDVEGGLDGEHDAFPLYEANDFNVPVDSVVRAWAGNGDWLVCAFGSEAAADALCQLTDKVYSGTCPTYTGFRVTDTGACSYSDAAVPHPLAICDTIYSEQSIDLVVAPPPSPRKALPGDMVDLGTAGQVEWKNPASAGVSDDSYATCALNGGQSSHYLKLTNFCFQLPTTTTSVTNVEVRVEARAAAGSSIADAEVKLVVAGSVTGTSQHTGVALGAADAVRSYSASPTTWTGGALTYSQVNASDFGVALRYAASSPGTVYVDCVEVRVSFEPASAGVVPACVVRLRRGDDGTYHLADHEPRVEIVQADEEAAPVVIGGVTYQPGFLMRYSQTAKDLVAVEDILLRDLSPLG